MVLSWWWCGGVPVWVLLILLRPTLLEDGLNSLQLFEGRFAEVGCHLNFELVRQLFIWYNESAQLQIVFVLVVHFPLAVHAHVQARPCLLLFGVPTAVAAAINICREGCHCCSLGGDSSC